MIKRKGAWKLWIYRFMLALLLIGIIWIINLIWFKPFNIRHFYDRLFVEVALDNPELVTSFGIPVVYDWSKDELTDISDKKIREDFEKLRKDYEMLMSYDFESQSKANQLNTKILGWYMKSQLDREKFLYHDYPVNQLSGVQNSLPSLMERSHKLRNKSDIKAYITRLSKFDKKFGQVLEGLKIRENNGIIPPKFVIDRVISEMMNFVGRREGDAEIELANEDPVLANILYTNFINKIETIEGLDEEEKAQYTEQVENEIRTTVFGAYNDLISYLTYLRGKATEHDGVWKLPNGAAYYQYRLKDNTTTDYTPEQVHQIGLSEVARIKNEMWEILINEGYTDTTQTIGTLIQQVNEEKRFLFPNNEEGRDQVIRRYNDILNEISNGLEDAFTVWPKAELEVKRVPEFKEEGSAAASYSPPPMDGSSGGIFYVNLRDLSETAKFEMKTLAYHEGIPGHHMQIAIQGELQDVPIFRTFGLFPAYVEGWALYAEQLAWELGFYQNDPFGNLGRLQYEMLRAVRLVVDTGIHSKKWTREEAIDYMVANTGMTTTEVTTEVERYIVNPGQACAYKVGMIKILELREKARDELGSTFDLSGFHDVVLKNGAVPLDILEEIIDDYIAVTLKKSNS
jgi:uncharacterized protein (DUF885 family)